MGSVIIAVAVVLCAAYLLWQVWAADLLDDRYCAAALRRPRATSRSSDSP